MALSSRNGSQRGLLGLLGSLGRPAALTASAALVAAGLLAGSGPASAAPRDPDLGPNVVVFDPSMPTAQIQATIDRIHAQQVDAEMGPARYALLFKPGVYGSVAEPLTVRVGYYTEVAGLGLSPADVTINGHVDVLNRCFPQPDGSQSCVALNNFWRSLSNLHIAVADVGTDGCRNVATFWAVSQAAPMRRVDVTGNNLSLMDFCSAPSFASGGFIADSRAGVLINGSQQQWYTRDSAVGTWTNGVWNQVFSGVQGAPAGCFPAGACGGPYTTLATTPVSKEKPFLYVDGKGGWRVFVPALRRDSAGPTWTAGPTAGTSMPLSRFYLARPGDSVERINEKLAEGKNLLLTPGVYDVARSIRVTRPGTIVLGLGLPTLSAQRGATAVQVGDVRGVDLAGLMVDAGPVSSAVLVRVGSAPHRPAAGRTLPPTTLHDVFFRIGGAQVGKAAVSLEVNSDDVLLDDIWAWRADHGNPGTVGWTVNTADTGLVVNGDDVTATGLFVEHYQKTEVVWNGERGRVIFFQNELPYDPPSQADWSRPGGVRGYPALKVSDGVQQFSLTGAGSYSFFNQGVDIVADNAFEVPATLAPGSLTNLLTVFLDPDNGRGGIEHVVNGVGDASTVANPSTPVTVTSYP